MPIRTTLCAAFALPFLSCASSPSEPGSDTVTHLIQEIRSIEIGVMESCPQQYVLNVVAARGSCGTIVESGVSRDGDQLEIRILVSTPRDIFCVAALHGYREGFPVGALAAGEYAVHAPGSSVSKTVTFSVADGPCTGSD